ncbi:nucleotidyl transferase AbiEii/AbiGii toxin family protein [Thioclava electrotropha]|uniref:Nucleotidyl transferase AbiEii/AbiGii toxin family protein n=1 Tax=Thioclava electrotropha TaxID=1549850 RepID=A0ABX6Z1C3_9RHOB|nr:nucleotidyl transferase AbiEii/AbiGii toxin family protein [Thioclava electrotropha]QPZ93375.1 nucleotidyl transferase AbiEii/AbiGii toxin family protein [Thioclava electrotropha]
MKKPTSIQGYNQSVTEACERVLVTLIRHLGPWRDSIFLVGGLTPRYIIEERPPAVPVHAGTGDVDVVVDMKLLADIEAYRTLEDNIRAIGFTRSENDKGQKLSWRWQQELADGTVLILEFLADAGNEKGGALQELPSEGAVSAIHIPHSAMVLDHFETVEITAELLGDGGITTETIRHADIVSFTCLKAFAFDHRAEPKDAHDLCYCLEHYKGGTKALRAIFEAALAGKHAETVKTALAILARRFCDGDGIEGYQKDGPVAAARFEGAEDWNADNRILRQRDLSAIVQDAIAPFI